MEIRALAVVILGCAVLLVPGCRGTGVSSEGVSASSTAETPVVIGLDEPHSSSGLSALGTVRPAQALRLCLRTSGSVRSVPVRLGSEVGAGDVLAVLDTTELEFELERAREEVVIRRAELEDLSNGPSAEVVQRAETEHAQRVTEAEIALQVAQRELERARLQGRAADVIAAQSKLQQLGLQLAQAETEAPVAEVVAARVDLARAQEALEAAMIGYKEALDRPWEPQRVRDAQAAAVTEAERGVHLAQARLASALNAQRAHTLGVEGLSVQRSEMEAQLAQALDAQAAYSVTLSLLGAEVNLARRRLEALQAWTNPYVDSPSPEEIAQARARLRQAELTVAQLEWRVEGAVLRAPFDGVASEVYVRPGEWSAAGEPVVELLDTTRWHVETRNVGELQIGHVRVGQEATVEVIAFRGQEFAGRIIAISPVAVVQQGDTTYTLLIELEPTELNLRPGMNAEVELAIE